MTYFVVGAGISGISAAELLINNNEKVILYDGNKELDIDALKSKNSFLENVSFILGECSEDVFDKVDVAVLSPGVSLGIPIVESIINNGITIWGEIELAYRYGKGRIVAITGTNGKTTTTALTGLVMSKHYKDVRVVGNIGIPYTKMIEGSTDETVFVAEISSFQLETIIDFKPDVSAILNITPDHLNRHHTMENYIKAKEDIAKNQNGNDVCVLNYEDENLREFGGKINTKVIYFSSARKLDEGLYYDDNREIICFASKGKVDDVISVDKLNILGLHNYENVMAAIAMGISMGESLDEIVVALKEFEAVEHRIEYVCEKKGVKFYNDSKGTNPDAAIKGVMAMNRPTFLIGGGYDKDSTYDEWIESFGNKVKKLVLIGQTKDKIALCCKEHGFNNYCFANSLIEAMDICFEEAVKGDAILLSPACASWGMYKNYEERGKEFKIHAREYKDA